MEIRFEDRVTLTIADGVATLALDRPKALNALDDAMATAIGAAAARCEVDPAVRAVIVAGGEHFMAGGDLRSFAQRLGTGEGSVAAFAALIHRVHAGIVTIHRMPKPVIASVRGACAGFGLSLMMACDLAVAADDAYFTLAYVNIGTSPDGGSTYALPRIVGTRRAMELALLGDRFGAADALHLGLVNRVVAPDRLAAETAALAARLAAGPALAIARTKRLVNASLDNTLEAQLEAEAEAFAHSAVTADFAEGVSAFLAKRKPQFRGH
jgi:2-(1,2-epoxy-1,2-dihydrophenyl)acetyl-CoA isomerase